MPSSLFSAVLIGIILAFQKPPLGGSVVLTTSTLKKLCLGACVVVQGVRLLPLMPASCIGVPGQVLAAPLSEQLPANVPRKAAECLDAGTHMGDLHGVPGLHLGQHWPLWPFGE